MPAKVLILGLPNTGKTTLLKPLKNVLVFSRDGKPFCLPLPHTNLPDFSSVDELLDVVQEKIDSYTEKHGKSPDTVVFDSVSRIFTEIVINCTNKYENFKIWENVDREISKFTDALSVIQESGFNVVLISHIVFDGEAKRYVETCAGKFAKTGGFLSVVDYAIHIDIVGNKRMLSHKNTYLSRTSLEGMPDKQNVDDFNLQEYIDKVHAKSTEITEEWSI